MVLEIVTCKGGDFYDKVFYEVVESRTGLDGYFYNFASKKKVLVTID